MNDFKPGEIVDITIKGVRVRDTSHIHVTITDENGGLWVLPPQAAVERVAPAEWPPQPGDLWRDCDGDVWLVCMVGDGETSAITMICAAGAADRSAEQLSERFGPLALVHREDAS